MACHLLLDIGHRKSSYLSGVNESWVLGIAAYANSLQLIYTLIGYLSGLWASSRTFKGGKWTATVVSFIWYQVIQRFAAAYIFIAMVQRDALVASTPDNHQYETVVSLSSVFSGSLRMQNLGAGGGRSGPMFFFTFSFMVVRNLITLFIHSICSGTFLNVVNS